MPKIWHRGGLALIALLCLTALVPRASAADVATAPAHVPGTNPSPFGVNSHIATRYGIYGQQQHPIATLKGTGAGWAREEFRWDWVEPARGQWDWGFTDEMVEKMTAAEIDLVGLLCYSVAWSAGSPAPGPVFAMPNLDDWANYVRTVVARYRDRVKYWEIWNEPNIPYFFGPQPDPAQYTELLRVSYQVIHEVDPEAKVLGGSVSGADLAFMEGMAAAGAWASLDIFSWHAYRDQWGFEQGLIFTEDMPLVKDFVDRQGTKPIWITEMGWSSGRDTVGLGSAELQADLMVKQYVQTLASPGVEKAFWYNLHDDGGDIRNDEQNYGLVFRDWVTGKPAYGSYAFMVGMLQSASFVGHWSQGAAEIFRFSRDGQAIDVVYTGGGQVPVRLATLSPAAYLYSRAGTRQTLLAAGGYLSFVATRSPVFVPHRAGE